MKNPSTTDLSGKVAVVTGSTSGIGLSVAQTLAAAGAHVTLNGLGDQAEIEQTRQNLEQEAGVKVLYSGADMTDPAQIQDMLEQTQNELGPIDILVNNAGVQYVSPIESFPPQRWDLILSINLSAPFYTIKGTIQAMKERKWGRIVNIASAHGLTASPFKSAYVASKHGVIGLTKVVALEGAEFGVTCNAICPGYVWTPMVANQIEETMKSYNKTKEEVINNILLARQPSKQFATVEEIGGLTLFLCSQHAAQITGTAISVDGGWTAL